MMWGRSWRCADTDAHLDEALMGELGVLRRSAFSRHRTACARCRMTVAQAVETIGALRALSLDTPSPDLLERVLAVRRVPEPVAVSWMRWTEITVVWAVCCMVAVISLVLFLVPGIGESPGEYGMAALSTTVHAVQVAGIIASVLVAGVSAVVWLAIGLGYTAFYAAALTGLRRVLVRRPI